MDKRYFPLKLLMHKKLKMETVCMLIPTLENVQVQILCMLGGKDLLGIKVFGKYGGTCRKWLISASGNFSYIHRT